MSWNYQWKTTDGGSVTISPEPYEPDGGWVEISCHGPSGEPRGLVQIPVKEWLECSEVIRKYLKSSD